jgi:hypothetical protein
MKKLLFICVAHLLLFACKKETLDRAPGLSGGDDQNNHGWVATISTEPGTDRDSILIKNADNNSNEHLAVKVRFYGAGEYFPFKHEARYTALSGAAYELDTTKVNVFQVEAFDLSTNAATGNFAASFIKTAGPSSSEKEINLTDGQF